MFSHKSDFSVPVVTSSVAFPIPNQQPAAVSHASTNRALLTGAGLDAAGYYVGGAGLALVLGWFGLFKFTPTEAAAIVGLVKASPLMSWLYQVLSVAATSRLIGVLELLAAAGLLGGWVWPRSGVVGGALATLIFFTTSTFLLSTPGVLAKVDGLWVPGNIGGFLIKDLGLLAASLACTAYSLRQVRAMRP